MNSAAIFSSFSVDWKTPSDVFEKLDKEFNFTYDPCPFQSEDKTSLLKDWYGRVFVNPPYSNIENFLIKALIELRRGNIEVAVFLIPSRTDTKWFHEHILGKYEIRFIRGRLRFSDSKHNAPFPSMVVILR